MSRGATMTRPWEPQPWVEPYQLAVGEMNVVDLPQRIQIVESGRGLPNLPDRERHWSWRRSTTHSRCCPFCGNFALLLRRLSHDVFRRTSRAKDVFRRRRFDCESAHHERRNRREPDWTGFSIPLTVGPEVVQLQISR